MTSQDLAQKLIAAAAGVLMGWVGQSLAISARVDAIEAAVSRIESRFDIVMGAKK